MRRLLSANDSQERVYDNKKGLVPETDIDRVSIQQLVERQDARPFDRRTDSEYSNDRLETSNLQV